MGKTILGLDLGTNSIGWALIEVDYEKESNNFLGEGKILGMGSRIIPMNEAILTDFGKGNSVSQTAQRTDYRGKRRLRQRNLLRRERLHRILNILDFLPEHYANDIDLEKRLGQFFENKEPKLPYKRNSKGKFEFLFQDSFDEMVDDFRKTQPTLFYKKENGEETKIPYDWTIYYLRKKALSEKIGKEELAWLILNFNQKRGYYQLRGEDEVKNDSKKEFVEVLEISEIEKGEKDKKNDKKHWFTIKFTNGWEYSATFISEPNWKDTKREFLISEEYDADGNIKIIKDKKTDAHGKEKRKITPLPSFEEIEVMSKKEQDRIFKKIKVKTELTISKRGKTVGEYIYETLLQKPNQKIRGKLVRTIERSFYKEEFLQILTKQIELQPELFTPSLYETCVKHLYRLNIPHQTDLLKKDFVHLFVNDIVFYQRPLKSKKSLISECKYEFREYTDKEGERKKQWLKCVAKSHPLYQEFRLWEWVQHLKIYEREQRNDRVLKTNVNVTDEFLSSTEDIEKLFEWLNDKKAIKQKTLLNYFKREGKKLTEKDFRWNFVEDKEYPCNETRAGFITVLKKTKNFDCTTFLTQETEIELWHTLYSISGKKELESALKKLANRLKVSEELLKSFNDFPPFKKDYGAFSYKALTKLLPFLRIGKYWNQKQFSEKIADKIHKIINGEADDAIQLITREKAYNRNLDAFEKFQGLPLWLASYVVYGRHSEASEKKKWKTPSDIERLKQHSLRNPIVEQVINETLQVVKDIWKHYGEGKEHFFNEIHVELGRDMKNPKNVRERLTKQITENQNTNQRIRKILTELMNDSSVEGDVKEYSPSQQDILKIYEEGALNSIDKLPDDIEKISRKAEPTLKEIQKYRLWLDQKYQSPYTGEMIPLSKLFTKEYEIEHVLPQSRYFDDSMSNKVICESVVNANPYKDNQTGYEFISNNEGRIVHELSTSKRTVKIFTKVEYEKFVRDNFKGKKKDIMLMEDIPEKFTERQLNDSRYISKVVLQLMSNIVRDKDEENINSKNVIPVNGKITSRLKNDWGLNDVWNELMSPRFQRMNELTQTKDFGYWDEKGGNKFFRNTVPEPLKKDFSTKRIDHRHHALDALVIALANRNHVNYLNNRHHIEKGKTKEEKNKTRHDLKRTLCFKTKPDNKGNYSWVHKKPWDGITIQTKEQLQTIVVSIKQNKRIINKNTNYIEKWKTGSDGQLKKVKKKQKKNSEWWSVRRPLHQETVHGKVKLRDKKEVSLKDALSDWKNIVDKEFKNWVKQAIESGKNVDNLLKQLKKDAYQFKGKGVKKVLVRCFKEGLSATRKPLDKSLNEKTIEAITDTGIQKILLNHLKQEEYTVINDKGDVSFDSELAFSPDGIEKLNQNIKTLNDGKDHKPIYKVRKYKAMGEKFPVGGKGNKTSKYVVAATGTNLFFAIYEGENEKGELVRQFNTIPLNEVILQLKDGYEPVPEKYSDRKENEYQLLFSLSPNDMVYLPTKEEQENPSLVDFNKLSKKQQKRMYLFTDGSGTTANFIPSNSSKVIFNMNKKDQAKNGLSYSIQNEYGIGSPQSKNQKSLDGVMIKDFCWKTKVDRLGHIKGVSSIKII